MKFENIFGMKTLAIGFGAALLLASTAHAQEVDNTVWDDSQNTVTYSQPAPAAQDVNSATSDSLTITPAAMIAAPLITQQTVASPSTPVDYWVIAVSLLCIALIALYALAEAKRANRHLDSRDEPLNRGPALS